MQSVTRWRLLDFLEAYCKLSDSEPDVSIELFPRHSSCHSLLCCHLGGSDRSEIFRAEAGAEVLNYSIFVVPCASHTRDLDGLLVRDKNPIIFPFQTCL